VVEVDDVLEELDASIFRREEQTVPGNEALDKYKETKNGNIAFTVLFQFFNCLCLGMQLILLL
jgi:hypothetical protein